MANHFPKQKRGFYEKSSQLSSVIENLRSYQLATGDVSSAQLTRARDKFGEDEGRVCASLVKDSVSHHGSTPPCQRRRRKRRRRAEKNKDTTPPMLTQFSPNKRPQDSTSSALSMLSTYSDSDDSDRYEVPPVIREMFSESPSVETSSKVKSDNVEIGGQLGFFGPGSSSSGEESSHEEVSAPTPDVPLSSFVCWKCSNVGHLPQDCTVATGAIRSKVRLSSQLRAHYDVCYKIKKRKGDRCAECGIHSNLASCLECGVVLCDGRGHLASHLSQHPTHSTLYSHKLQRMLKCCKGSCDVVSIYDLLMCSVCLGKAFTQNYSLVSATWSRAGLKAIPNALCCEEHFQWHRMNCPHAAEEHFVSAETLQEQSGLTGFVSEFFL